MVSGGGEPVLESDLFNQLGLALQEQGRLREAGQATERALGIDERVYGARSAH
jgi:hypothetical protein